MLARFFEWILSRPPAELIAALAALVTALRIQSNREHRKTLEEQRQTRQAVNDIGVQMDDGNGGGMVRRVEAIERELRIKREDHYD